MKKSLQILSKISGNSSTISSFIDGKFLPTLPDRLKIPNYSPATGQILCEIQCANNSDLENAFESSKEGLTRWSRYSSRERGRVLQKASELLRNVYAEELVTAEVSDVGKPISEARGVDIPSAADALEYFGSLSCTLSGSFYSDLHLESDSPPSSIQTRDHNLSFAYTKREPLGICGAIGAWNYPLQIACWKAGPALAAGNSMIFKPSENSPLTALILAKIFLEAGLPSGVFNVLLGSGDIGQSLARHPQLAKISFTGSVPTGQAIIASSAVNLAKVTVELGGKSPLVIFGDAKLEEAISVALMANFYTQGEICSNGTRVFVEDSLYHSFVERMVSRVKGGSFRIGNPFDPETNIGALISKQHLETVANKVTTAIQEGAHLAYGGEKYLPPNEEFRNGYYYVPTILTECTDDMSIVREEVFGPVMTVHRFQTEEEVIKRANSTAYGLAAGVLTNDIKRAHRVVARFDAGTCWINNYNLNPIRIPFGGFKKSGYGKENCEDTLQDYTRLKSVIVEMHDPQSVF